MQPQAVIQLSIEPLEADELVFLRKKEAKDRAQFYKVLRALLLLCFICPFLIAWIRALAKLPDPFSYKAYFLGVLFLIGFSGIAAYISYYYFLRRVQQDIKKGTKTIEPTHITRKQFMAQINTYYFYLDSPTHISIEVNADDYARFKKGDEVNIEYTTFSKMYLGYF